MGINTHSSKEKKKDGYKHPSFNIVTKNIIKFLGY
jgi:hypothetical protein